MLSNTRLLPDPIKLVLPDLEEICQRVRHNICCSILFPILRLFETRRQSVKHVCARNRNSVYCQNFTLNHKRAYVCVHD